MIIDTENNLTYDHDVRALYLYFDRRTDRKNSVAKTISIDCNCFLDFDKEGNALGLEILLGQTEV
jgi:uncharacterized protein YuzE